jgi:hypothetical protein
MESFREREKDLTPGFDFFSGSVTLHQRRIDLDPGGHHRFSILVSRTIEEF